jgi:hypothetical protein
MLGKPALQPRYFCQCLLNSTRIIGAESNPIQAAFETRTAGFEKVTGADVCCCKAYTIDVRKPPMADLLWMALLEVADRRVS